MINERFLAELKELLGAGDDLTADNALSRLRERLAQQDSILDALTRRLVDKQASLSTVTEPDAESGKSMMLGAGVKPSTE